MSWDLSFSDPHLIFIIVELSLFKLVIFHMQEEDETQYGGGQSRMILFICGEFIL